jgi:hypothetical protein
MKKMLLLPLVLSILSGASLPTQSCANSWKVEVEVNSKLRFTFRMESDPSRGASFYAFRLRLIEGPSSVRSLVLFQIGDRPHA